MPAHSGESDNSGGERSKSLELHRPMPVSVPLDQEALADFLQCLNRAGSLHVEELHDLFVERQSELAQATGKGSGWEVDGQNEQAIKRDEFFDIMNSVSDEPLEYMESWGDIFGSADVVDFRRFLSYAAIVRFAKEAAMEGWIESEDEEENEAEEGGRGRLLRQLYGLYAKEPQRTIGLAELKELVADVLTLSDVIAQGIERAAQGAGAETDWQARVEALVQRLWGSRAKESTIEFQDFSDLLVGLELPACGDQDRSSFHGWPSMSLGRSGTGVPSLCINGKQVSRSAVVFGQTKESASSVSGSDSWTYLIPGPITIRQFEVGLRKRLQSSVMQGGAGVLVQIVGVHTNEESEVLKSDRDNDPIISESAVLQYDNNFRCSWPELSQRPASFREGLKVVFTLIEGGLHSSVEGSSLMRANTAGAPTSEFPPTNWNLPPSLGKRKFDILQSEGGPGSPEKEVLRNSTKDGDGSPSKGTPAEGINFPRSAKKQPMPGGNPRKSPTAPGSPAFGAKRMPWKLASHTVKLNRYQGTVERFESLWNPNLNPSPGMDGASGTHSGPHTPRSLRPITPTSHSGVNSPVPFESPVAQVSPRDPPPGLARNRSDKFDEKGARPRRYSEAPFKMESAPNQLLEALRFFELPLPEKQKPAFCWGNQAAAQLKLLASYIVSVARDVRKVCLAEPRCVHVRAPCYILGDLHGNYLDLIAFEKALWRIGVALSPANFLFLGDYVDRGSNSLELIVYLLAQKALCPEKIVLLRGNHEMRTQNSYSAYNPCFRASCVNLFGDEMGIEVWECINKAFDTFPLAAVVDNSIFCVHGGIPSAELLGDAVSPTATVGLKNLVNNINKIPQDLPQPDPSFPGGNALAWDLMWNDPAPSEKECVDEVGNDGFGPNKNRGTAHVFNADALESFLRVFGLSHLVRAHEMRKTGFQVQQHNQMATIFSSSGYCGATNEACCILACEGKIRFIRLEHSLQPKLISLASKAAAASAMAAALGSDLQRVAARHQQSLAQNVDAEERSEDIAAAASLAAAAVDNGKLRPIQAFETTRNEVSPQQRLQQRIQQRLQERLKQECIKSSTGAGKSQIRTPTETMEGEEDGRQEGENGDTDSATVPEPIVSSGTNEGLRRNKSRSTKDTAESPPRRTRSQTTKSQKTTDDNRDLDVAAALAEAAIDTASTVSQVAFG